MKNRILLLAKRTNFVVVIAALSLPLPVYAWGPIGHRVSATIAEHNISGKTRAEITQILGNESIVEASNWPDEQRANPDDYWQVTSPAFHLFDVPTGLTARAAPHPPQGDAVTALTDFVATLRDPNAPLADKQRALRFVVHIVEDTHQPLHVSKGADRHGLNFVVSLRSPIAATVTTNMHFLWDVHMVPTNLSASEYASQLEGHITPEQAIAWWTADPFVWIDESASLQKRIYPASDGQPDVGTTDTPAIIPRDYSLKWRPVMEERLKQAGIRLAAYLDWIFAGE